ncbi:MAG: MFS transporter [Thiotrichales bacterium]
MGQDTPYFRLSSFYFFYFASIGAFVPYWSVYLESLGFTPGEIGELIAISMMTKLIAPYLWGWVADLRGNRLRVIRWTSFFAALSFAGIFVDQSYWSMALVLGVFSFFWHAALPQFEAVTLNHLGANRMRYSLIRLWGSVGFIVVVIGLGYWFERFGVGILPLLFVALLLMIWLVSALTTTRPELQIDHKHLQIRRVITQGPVLIFLIAAFLMQLSHGPYYTFFSIYLQDHGYASSRVGELWAVGVIAEIGVFLFAHQWLNRYGALRLFQLSILITAARWLLLANFVDSLLILILIQTLHAASYGLFHAASIELVHQYFPGKLQGRGQALYASASFGLGNALGSWGSGYLWGIYGDKTTYILAATICFIGFLVSLTSSRLQSVKL